ncbi:MAG: M20/M25/M40 family metallo-hydrolase [Candidatus Marinimicrobia bacterium]|nr:M20/M25/M40 family metallo-hydrolase [Candidatus Neomarinimicrobiota bacterium]
MKKIILITCVLTLIQAEPNWEKARNETVDLFQQYLRIDTSNPPGDVRLAAKWFADILGEEGISYEIFTVPQDSRRMHVLAELPGMNPELKPLLLLNHMDVVPVDINYWDEKPFDGELRDGVIYGRGTIDMKSLGIMHLMALMQLHREGWQPERTIKFLAVADEEILGPLGTSWMIENHWDKLDPQWVWDEGGVGSLDSFSGMSAFAIAVAQKKSFWVEAVVEGKSGHGMRPYKDHPNEILVKALTKIVNWNTPLEIAPVVDEMFNRMGKKIGGGEGLVMESLDNGLVRYFTGGTIANSSVTTNAMLRNTISLTMLTSGYKTNIIPEKATATLDIRLLPHVEPEDFLEDLKFVVNDNRVKFIPKRIPRNKHVSNWETDFFNILSDELNREKPDALAMPFMTIGGTDSQFFQEKGVDCYGLIPIMITEKDIQSIHGIDESLSVENLMMGTRIVYRTIKRVCGPGE